MFPDFTRCYASGGKLSHGIFKYMQWWIGLTVLLKFLWFPQCLRRDSQYPDTVTFLLDHPSVAMCHASSSTCSLLWQITQPILASQSCYPPVLEFLRQPINENYIIVIHSPPFYFSLYNFLINTEKYKEKI